MGFYDNFAEKYDELAWQQERKKKEKQFFKRFLSKHGEIEKVLDCACGTGHHPIILDELGCEVKASDASKQMIKKARDNINGRDIDFRISDFRELSDTFDEVFDLVVCPGNSFAHLLSMKDLEKALKEINEVLNEGGILLLNQRNFDLLLEEKKRFIPMTITEDFSFLYVLDYLENSIQFNVVRRNLKNNRVEVSDFKMNPITKEDMEELLRKSNFEKWGFYKENTFSEFEEESDRRYNIVAHKSE